MFSLSGRATRAEKQKPAEVAGFDFRQTASLPPTDMDGGDNSLGVKHGVHVADVRFIDVTKPV